MDYCDAGKHPDLNVFEYAGTNWCPAHLPPPADQDPPDPGWCEQGRGHWSRDTIFIRSRTTRWCHLHLEANIREYLRRGEWKR